MLSPEIPNRFRDGLSLGDRRVIVPISGVLEQPLVDQVIDGALAAEVRIDYFLEPGGITKMLHEAARFNGIPIIGTLRSADQGGKWTGKTPNRLKIIKATVDCFDVIDAECDAHGSRDIVAIAHDAGKAALVSVHDMSGTPTKASLESKLERAFDMGADYFKFAVTADTEEDLDVAIAFTQAHKDEPVIGVTMGQKGALGRVLLMQNGSIATFAYIGDNAVATGQLSLAEMKHAIGEKD